MSLNKAMLIGNVGKDPEIRYLDGPERQKVATFSLATSEKYKDREGNPKEATEWHNIVAWRAAADFVENYVKSGMQLYVEGRLRTRSWTDRNGATKRQTEIQAENLQILGRKQDHAERHRPGTGTPAPAMQPAPAIPEPETKTSQALADDDDLPF